MPLSVEQKNRNQEQLQVIKTFILSVWDGIEQFPLRKLEQLEQSVMDVLDEHQILLGLHEGDKELQELLQNALLAHETREDEWKKNLKKWALHYQALDQQASQELRHLSSQQARGIMRSLLDFGGVSDTVWGDDYDLRILFKEVLTDPHEIKENGTFILPPISLVAARNASKAEHAPFLKTSIEPALRASANKTINLLIPVNCGQSHWCLADIKISNGLLEQGILWDSMANSALEKTKAFENMRSIVKQINSNANCEAKTTKKQMHGFECMDCTAQQALILLSKAQPDVAIDAGLQAIRDAKNVVECRDAIVAKMMDHPQFKSKNERMVKEDKIKNIFNQREFTSEVENQLLETLENKDLHVENITVNDLRNHFDGILAQKLNDLYREQSHQDDAVLFKIARKEVYFSLQKRFGFFSDVQKTNAVLHESASATNKKNISS